MSNRLVNNAGAKKRAKEIGSAVKGNTISNSRNALDLARSLGGSANGSMRGAATGAVKGTGTTGSMRGAATGAVSGVSSGVTKDPSDVIGTLTDNATVDASPKGGVAAVAKGTDSQNTMDQLNNYYRQQAAKEKSDLAYADYLTGGKVSQDIKYGNYLTNGRYSGYNSYADYLASIGQTPQDSQKTRDASVARANADYARALAGYGQTGEQLARSGLSNTGYSDASNNAAYAAKQNAILQADATKAATDQSNRLGYAQYLQAYDAQQQNKMLTVLEYTTQAGMTEEQAKAYAKAVGFDDTIAESIGKAQAAYTKSTSGTATKATDLYNTLVSNENFAYDPATKNSMRQQLLNSGYDEVTVDDVLGRLDKSYTTAQDDTYNLIMKSLTDDNAVAKIGSTIKGWDEMDQAQRMESLDKYVLSSSLDNSQKAKYFTENISNMLKSGRSMADVLNELASYSNIGMNTTLYDNVMKTVSDALIGQIEENRWMGYTKVTVGNKTIRLQVNTGMRDDYSKTLPKGEKGSLMAGTNGKIYKVADDGKWHPVTSISGNSLKSEAAKQLYNLIYQKLK
jgi:hypothetical protein